MKYVLLLLSFVAIVSCGKAQPNQMPYPSSGILYKAEPGIPGKIVYVSTERPFTANGEVAGPGNLSEQTKQVFENIKKSLATVNLGMEHINQVTYTVKGPAGPVDAATVALLKSIGAQYLPQTPAIVDVKSSPNIVRDDILIEIEAIAIK